MSNKIALGLDVAKATIEVCLLRQGQKRGDKTTIENSIAGGQKLLAWLHSIELTNIHVCLEPTGKYSRVIAAFLHQAGLKVSQVHSFAVLNHGRSKNYRNKTDKIDAYLLADYCLKEDPTVWEPAASAQVELSELQARIDDIEEMIQQEQSRLGSGGASSFAQADMRQHIAELSVKKEGLENVAKDLVETDPLLCANFKIINSIVGLGEKSSLLLLSAIRFECFEKSRDVGCFAGLTPRKYQSGTRIKVKEKISKIGNRRIRGGLYFPAMVAIQHNPQMRAFADRLRAKGKEPQLIICAVMRKLLVLAATLIRNQTYYDPTKGLTAN